MEIIFPGIDAFFAWLIFFKFKWLPWDIVARAITITQPIFSITALILVLNRALLRVQSAQWNEHTNLHLALGEILSP